VPDPNNRAHIVAAKAKSLCSVNFRLHGRDTETGLDCIGFMQRMEEIMEILIYSIRSGNAATIILAMKSAGFAKIPRSEVPREGDVLLVQPSPVQLHFMICTEGGFVHAHAGLGRVVFAPGRCPWPILHIFRIVEA